MPAFKPSVVFGSPLETVEETLSALATADTTLTLTSSVNGMVSRVAVIAQAAAEDSLTILAQHKVGANYETIGIGRFGGATGFYIDVQFPMSKGDVLYFTVGNPGAAAVDVTFSLMVM